MGRLCWNQSFGKVGTGGLCGRLPCKSRRSTVSSEQMWHSQNGLAGVVRSVSLHLAKTSCPRAGVVAQR